MSEEGEEEGERSWTVLQVYVIPSISAHTVTIITMKVDIIWRVPVKYLRSKEIEPRAWIEHKVADIKYVINVLWRILCREFEKIEGCQKFVNDGTKEKWPKPPSPKLPEMMCKERKIRVCQTYMHMDRHACCVHDLTHVIFCSWIMSWLRQCVVS